MAASRLLAVVSALLCMAAPIAAADGAWDVLDEPGTVVLIRHARAPGTGDPAGFLLGDCATQRNLNDQGRAQAWRIGEAFRANGVTVGRVLSSQWCRALETAQLAFPGRVEPDPAFNSFFADPADEPQTTAAGLGILANWTGPGVLVAVTHQVNITALTGITASEGAGVIVRVRNGTTAALGQLPLP